MLLDFIVSNHTLEAVALQRVEANLYQELL